MQGLRLSIPYSVRGYMQCSVSTQLTTLSATYDYKPFINPRILSVLLRLIGICHQFSIRWELICLQCTAAACSELWWPHNINYICWLDLELAINVFTPVIVQTYVHLTKWSSGMTLWQSLILSWIFSHFVQSCSQRSCFCLSTQVVLKGARGS